MEYLHKDITNNINRTFCNANNNLGYGFLEKVYENAMLIESETMGVNCVEQKPIPVYYKSLSVGEYFADIIVESKGIIELKAVEGLIEEHEAQLLNYLKATDIEVGLLLNFGKNLK